MSDNTPDIVDVTDSGDTNSTPLDSSVLSGASAPDATAPTPDATAVAPTAQPITPNYSTTPLAQPTPTAPNVPSAPAPNIQAVTGTPAIPPAPQGQPSVWKDLVAGALYGLAGSAGAKHFGAGLAGGVEGNLQQKQQQIENTQRQQQLNFESVQAADSHIKALAEINQANQLTDNEKLDYKQKQAEYQNFLQDNFGIEPNLSFNDSHADGIAALSTASTMNGGQIPPAAISFQPAPDGVHGTISAYSPSQQQMQQNTNGFRDLINRQRQAQGLPDIDTATFNSLGFKGQRDAAQAAITFFSPTPTFSLDKTKSDYLPVVLAQKQQQLGLYQNHKDINGTPDADPNTEQQMQASIDYLQKAWDKSNSMEAAQAQQQAGATEQGKEDVENNPSNVSKKAAAAGQVTTAEENAKTATLQGRATLAKTQADTQKDQLETDQLKREAAQIGQPDPTGFSSQLTSKEYDKRYDAFTKSKQYMTLQTLQGSYQQFQAVKSDLDAGKDMTGAQSVVGLFNAIGISATPLAGKGMRINQNTIEEHVGARGIDQSAYQKLLSLKNGDVITPQQLRDYSTIATQVYRDSYVNAVDEAHRQGLPADFLPQGGGQKVDAPTADIYTRSLLHTNPQLANNPVALKKASQAAAQANGWAVQ